MEGLLILFEIFFNISLFSWCFQNGGYQTYLSKKGVRKVYYFLSGRKYTCKKDKDISVYHLICVCFL